MSEFLGRFARPSPATRLHAAMQDPRMLFAVAEMIRSCDNGLGDGTVTDEVASALADVAELHGLANEPEHLAEGLLSTYPMLAWRAEELRLLHGPSID